jgi:hypothetical protein
MSLKNKLVAALSLLVVLVGVITVITRIGSSIHTSVFNQTEKSVLSGVPGKNGPILVVKIDDTNMAHPQVGLESADIIYIEQVEGGLTRLAAIYSSRIPQLIGPIRSARVSDLELLAQFGKVGFAYSGAQSKFRPEIESANLVDLGAQSKPPTIYTTDPNRIQPYAMILRADLLMDFVSEKEIALSTPKDPGWSFAQDFERGIAISSAHVSWPASSYDVSWSQQNRTWQLSHNGKPNLSASGKILTADTFVIQIVKISDSIYRDKVGGITPLIASVGSGNGYILRDGRYIEARWNRLSSEVGTQWTTPEGAEIPFKAGAIWIALTDKAPRFTEKTEGARDVATK